MPSRLLPSTLQIAWPPHIATARTSNRCMEGSKPRSRRLWYWCAIVWFLALGYLSAWTSSRPCQIRTARWLMKTVPRGKPFFIPQEDAKPQWLEIWNSVGANFRVHDPSKDGPDRIPWCALRNAHPRYPFVAVVEYGWVREPEVGDGGRLWYFCLFGFTIELGRTIDWMT